MGEVTGFRSLNAFETASQQSPFEDPPSISNGKAEHDKRRSDQGDVSFSIVTFCPFDSRISSPTHIFQNALSKPTERCCDTLRNNF